MAQFEVTLKDGTSGPAKSMADSLGSMSNSLGSMTKALDKCGIPVGGLASKIGSLSEAFGPVGIAVAAVIVVLGAFVAAAAAVVAAAISITQERDALVNTFDALGKGAGAGEKTVAMLDRMSKTLPFTTSQLAKIAKGLEAAGIQGMDLEHGITAVAAATAIMGESGGKAAEKLINRFAEAAAVGNRIKIDKGLLKQLAASGVSADALAAELGTTADKLATMSLSAKQMGDAMQSALSKKGAGALADMGLTWDSISAKLHEGLGSIFEGLSDAVKPFMQAIQSLFGEFGRGSAVTSTAGGIVKAVLGEMFAAATKVINWIHKGFLMAQIAFLKVKIAIAPITAKLKELWVSVGGSKLLIGAMKAFAVVLGIVATAVLICIAPLILLAAITIAVYAAIGWLAGVIADFVSGSIDALSDWASGAVDAVSDFISGIVDGIKNGVGMVVDAVKGLGGAAISAFKGVLGIHSPSAIMRVQGRFTSAGLAEGIEGGTDAVHAAARGAGRAAIAGAADGLDGAAGAPGRAGKGGVTVNVAAGAVVVNGAGGEDILTLTEEAIGLVFERVALRQGLVT